MCRVESFAHSLRLFVGCMPTRQEAAPGVAAAAAVGLPRRANWLADSACKLLHVQGKASAANTINQLTTKLHTHKGHTAARLLFMAQHHAPCHTSRSHNILLDFGIVIVV